MRQIEQLLNKIYDRNPETGHYKIEVSLKNYAEIFNDWDHAPYKRKDIDPDLLAFLEDSIDDIPMPYPIDICFYISDEAQNRDREALIRSWFKTFYTFYIFIEKSKARKIAQQALVYFIVSVALLTASFFGMHQRNSIIEYTLTEIVIVGGWVFLWEAISKIIFERQVIGKLIKNYRRFVAADIEFKYQKPMGLSGNP